MHRHIAWKICAGSIAPLLATLLLPIGSAAAAPPAMAEKSCAAVSIASVKLADDATPLVVVYSNGVVGVGPIRINDPAAAAAKPGDRAELCLTSSQACAATNPGAKLFAAVNLQRQQYWALPDQPCD